MRSYTIEWKRLITEGGVIVVSILLAFAIDAWWHERQQGNEANDQAARVLAELRANAAIVEKHIENLKGATGVVKTFLDLLGPEPPPTPVSRVAELLEGVYSSSTVTLERGAATDFLSSGQLTDTRWTDIRIALASALSYASVAESASAELRGMRESVRVRLDEHVSGLDLVIAHPFMHEYESSRFASDTDALLSDMRFESALANYAIRMEINLRYWISLKAQLEQLIVDIESTAFSE